MPNLFKNRRKSSGNVIEDAEALAHTNGTSPIGQSSEFRVLDRAEIERKKLEAAAKQQEKSSKGFRFSAFGSSGKKGRSQSIDEDSPPSSKRYVN